MSKLLQFFSFVLLGITGFLIFVNPVLAQSEIETSQDVTYQVFESGKTKVTHNIQLTNLSTNYYASEYSLFLGYDDIENVIASDSQGALRKDITSDDKGVNIHLEFND